MFEIIIFSLHYSQVKRSKGTNCLIPHGYDLLKSRTVQQCGSSFKSQDTNTLISVESANQVLRKI